MKNKSLIVIISILAFIVLIVILSSTIFCLKSVELNFMSNTINLTNKQEEIIESGNFKYNQSIFFINKNVYIKRLEENNPHIKIINIETIFPNKLVINCVERNELFAIKSYDGQNYKNYLIFDDELKILASFNEYNNSHTNPILITIENERVQTSLAGQTLITTNENIIKKLASELYAYNNNPLLLKANFEEIIINDNSNNNIRIKMRSGVDIVLKEMNILLTEKFMLALSYYNNLEDKTKGTITIYENNENKVVGYYYE